MMESVEFLASLVICLAFIAIPVGGVGFVFRKMGKNQDRSLD